MLAIDHNAVKMGGMEKPTGPQLEVFFYVIQHICEHGLQPTHEQMAEAFGVTKQAIAARINLLAKKGLVQLSADARGIKLKGVRFRPVFEKHLKHIEELLGNTFD